MTNDRINMIFDCGSWSLSIFEYFASHIMGGLSILYYQKVLLKKGGGGGYPQALLEGLTSEARY